VINFNQAIVQENEPFCLASLSWWHTDHFLAPVSGVRNRHQLSGGRNNYTLSWQMIWAEKNKDGLRFWEFWTYG